MAAVPPVDVMSVWLPNHARGPQDGHDWLENCWDVMFPNPIRGNAETLGWFGGIGLYWEEVQHMWYAVAFALLWFTARYLSKSHVFPPIARALGMRSKKKQAKFSYNMWLLIFYASSSLYGWFFVLPGEGYFRFPLGKEGTIAMFRDHPIPITPKYHWYYMYQLGFYIAELYAIFVEDRRSDFLEYVIHHVVTIWLIAVSYIAHEQRVGAMIIFLHDVPDVVLCMTKMFHYTGYVNVSSALFVAFAGVFFYLRLYCFPMVSYGIFCLSPKFHPSSYGFWALATVLGIVLQALQVFWFAMIIKVFVNILLKGNEGDPRSDDDEESAGPKDRKTGKKPTAPKETATTTKKQLKTK